MAGQRRPHRGHVRGGEGRQRAECEDVPVSGGGDVGQDGPYAALSKARQEMEGEIEDGR